MRPERRRFLRSLAVLPLALKQLSCAPAGTAPRSDRHNPFKRRGASTLVVVEGSDLNRLVPAGLNGLPGTGAAFRRAHVVLKPNATASEPYPVTTDLQLLRELIRYLKGAGAASITICDSPSFAGLSATGVFRKLGYTSLADTDAGVRVTVVDPLVGTEFVRASNPAWQCNPAVLTSRPVRDADIVINLCIPKRHHLSDFSCALKNNFGCTADTFRSLAHLWGGARFDQSLVEFADAVRPQLTVVDARKVLARNGPTFRRGQSEIVATRRLVLTTDMVAADSYCADLMEEVDSTFSKANRVRRQLDYAAQLGLGEPDLRKIELVRIE